MRVPPKSLTVSAYLIAIAPASTFVSIRWPAATETTRQVPTTAVQVSRKRKKSENFKEHKYQFLESALLLSSRFSVRADSDHRALGAEIIGALHSEGIGNPTGAVDDESVFVAAG